MLTNTIIEADLDARRGRGALPGYGRFMQPDPLGYEDDTNPYAYVGNDPISNTDPLGLCIGRDRPNDCVQPVNPNDPIVITGTRPSSPGLDIGTIMSISDSLLVSSGVTGEGSGAPIVVTGRRPAPTPEPPIVITAPRVILLPPTTSMRLPLTLAAAPYNPRKNYCGGEGGTSLPNIVGGVSINDICYDHDVCYGASGTPRSVCDSSFGLGLIRRLERHPTFGDPIPNLLLSILGGVTGYTLVHIGGRDYYVPR